MSWTRSMRIWRRQLAIRGAVAAHLDRAERWRERRHSRRGAPVMRVVYLHSTPASQAATLRAHLRWLQQEFDVIDFPTFKRTLTLAHVPEPDRPSLLLTFDDGLVSNYRVAAPILEELGLRALFFVVPGFSQRTGLAAYRFCRERILRPRVETAMTPAQIADLAARGHTIGNHTYTHANLLHATPAEYQHEIVESAAAIEAWIGQPVDAFAWPFRWNAITPAAYRLAADRHRYCFAPCAGRIHAGTGPQPVLWRTNIEAHFRPAELSFQCSRLADGAAWMRRRDLSRRLTPDALDLLPRVSRTA